MQWLQRVGGAGSKTYKMCAEDLVSAVPLASVLMTGTFLQIQETAAGVVYILPDDDAIQAERLQNQRLYTDMDALRARVMPMHRDLAVSFTRVAACACAFVYAVLLFMSALACVRTV